MESDNGQLLCEFMIAHQTTATDLYLESRPYRLYLYKVGLPAVTRQQHQAEEIGDYFAVKSIFPPATIKHY